MKGCDDYHVWHGPLYADTRCLCGAKAFGESACYIHKRREARSWGGIESRIRRAVWGGNGLTHWRNGIDSGFPVCCVLWFVTVWEVALLVRDFWPHQRTLAERFRTWYRVWDGVDGRIGCPFCKLLRRRA